MNKTLLASACLFALFATAAAATVSAREAPSQRPLVGGHGNDIGGFVAQHDENADGRLGWAEFEAFRRQRFDTTDADGNGTVDVEEYVQEFDDRLRQELENARSGHVEQAGRRFAALDADKDGGVSRAEYAASGDRMFDRFQALPAEGGQHASGGERRRDRLGMPTSHARDGFLELFDADGDGTVGRAEFDTVRSGQFVRTDGDGDGRLDEDEYLAEFEDRLDRRIATVGQGSGKQTRVRFDALDADKDGAMTFAEYQASGKRTFDRADRDHDGTVDAQDGKLPSPPMPERRRDDAPATGANTSG